MLGGNGIASLAMLTYELNQRVVVLAETGIAGKAYTLPLKATSAPTATTATRIAFCIVCSHNCSLPGERPWLRTWDHRLERTPTRGHSINPTDSRHPFFSPTRSAVGRETPISLKQCSSNQHMNFCCSCTTSKKRTD